MWIVLMIGGPIFILSLFMKETLKARMLYTQHKDSPIAHETLKGVLIVATTRSIRMLFVEPLVLYLSIYTAFGFAMLFSFFGSYQIVFEYIYHFDQKGVGLAFIGILIGFLLAIVTFGIFDATLYRKALERAQAKGRQVAPEHRLYSAMFGSVMLPVALFWLVSTLFELVRIVRC